MFDPKSQSIPFMGRQGASFDSALLVTDEMLSFSGATSVESVVTNSFPEVSIAEKRLDINFDF